METDWDIADEDLEQLLEFEDSDPVLASNIRRKQLPSNTRTLPSTADHTRSIPKYADAVNLRNCPEQLQAEEKQATEVGDKLAEEGDGETSHPRTSSGDSRGVHQISQHSVGESDGQNLDEESSSFNYKEFDDARTDCNDEGDVNDQDGEYDVRFLSGGRRDRGVSVGAGSGSSKETTGRASKRIRQDWNVGTEWDDPPVVDDFGKGGKDCSQGGLPDGKCSLASPVWSSPKRPLVQEAAEDGKRCHISGVDLVHPERECLQEKETSPPVTVLGYKIPGPAGAVQSCLNSAGYRAKGLTHYEKYCGPGRLSHMSVSVSDTLDFREGPWLAAMDFLNNVESTFGNHSSRSTIVNVKATKRHIPQLVVIINTVVRNGSGDLSVTLKDPTGTISGTIHRKVLTEVKDGHLISPGAVLIIRKVAVFSPTPFKHYLNIIVKNVDRIFGKDTIAPKRRRKASNDKNDFGIPGKDHPFPKPGFIDTLPIQTAAKEGNQPEVIAPDREGVTDLTRPLANDERIQANETLGSDTRVSNSELLQDAVDSRKRAVTANVGNPNDPASEVSSDTRAIQDARAKAAGWDFSEDVEDLLADDIFCVV